MLAERVFAAIIAVALSASFAFAEAPPPTRSDNGDIDDTYIKPEGRGVWGSLLSGLGLGSFSKSHALIVGISDFDAYSDLPTANDPVRMRAYLIEEAGFDVVITLTGQNVTKARIAELMVDDFPDSVGPDDRFLFYWSGHGVTRQRGDAAFGFLPLANSRPDRNSSMIAMADLARWDQFLQAKQVLYLLDSCFSGLAGVAPQSDLRRLNEGQLMGPSRHLLTAGTGDQETIAIDRLGGSVFTAAVLDGLRNGLADTANGQYPADGLVSVEELKLYVSSRVADEARISGWTNPITPQLREMRTSPGAFFFAVPDGRYGLRRGDNLAAANPDDRVTPQGGSQADISVATLQEGLTELGLYDGPADGVLNFATQKAIGQFQGSEDLPITGQPDEDTRLRLLQRLVSAKLDSEEEPPTRTESFRDCDACPEMVPVDAGTMTLGSNSDEHPEEGPTHDVTLAPFAMARTEITHGQWRAYLKSKGTYFDNYSESVSDCYQWDFSASPARLRQGKGARRGDMERAGLPLNCVSHIDVQDYLDWLNAQTGGGYRLPTEAELEFAMRSQTLPTDPAAACDLLNGALNGPKFPNRGGPCPVGASLIDPVASHAANPLGIHDLYGNLWEMSHNCWTFKADDYETWAQDLAACSSGTVPVRGGSFDDPPASFRPTIRQQVPNIRRQENIGFRVVKFPLDGWTGQLSTF